MWLPNKWIAAFLGFVLQPIGMLYVAKPRLAFIYFSIIFFISITELYLSINYTFEWQQYFSFSYIVMFTCAFHAYKIATSNQTPISRPWYSKWHGLTSIPFALIILIFLFRSFLFEPFRIPAVSMFPTLLPGTIVVAQKWGYGNYGTFGITIFKTKLTNGIERGDLVVFEYPGNPSISYIKRIIGMPGELIEYKDKQLFINSEIVSTEFLGNVDNYSIYNETINNISYRIALINERQALDTTYIIPEGHYFVLGDNRDNSNDSRYWGALPEKNIVGKVIKTIETL